MKRTLLALILITLIGCAKAQNPNVTLVDAYQNLTFNKALHLTHAGDGTNRVFVVTQVGQIIVFPNDSNVTAAQTNVFLNVSNKLSSTSGEQGLLGLAFHPNYSTNGYIFINYTAGSPLRTVISRFKIQSGNPNKIDSLSEYKILEINQPFSNHNGGTVMFGQDGFLYIGMGDGGSGGDPSGNAQNLQVLLGKMLRIDINDTSASRRYVIPNTNPFYNNPTAGKEEIYTWGMRNPWKYSQDPVTGLIYCADVGQGNWEEIDIIENGKNYGWKVMEGFVCYSPSTGCDTSGKKLPIKAYNHSGGDCSVTGGYVYRGNRRPELRGAYIYGDYCSGKIWMLRYNSGVVTSDSLLTQKSIALTSFGVDQFNELYVIASAASGKIWRFNKSPLATGINENGLTPEGYNLYQNYPNPFNPNTMISYYLPKTGLVKLQVFDINGKQVRTLVNNSQTAGRYGISFNGKDDNGANIPSAIYYYTLSSDDFTETRKMVMIK
ncbi:MAG: PQQ-dependent sugar dehydrogenase [Candidatus Kapaibacterium sp.]